MDGGTIVAYRIVRLRLIERASAHFPPSPRITELNVAVWGGLERPEDDTGRMPHGQAINGLPDYRRSS
jgi:hypothetical protein